MAHPYKASKAWHHSVSLASDVERLVAHFKEYDEPELAQRMQQASSAVHQWLADSHEYDKLALRLDCYQRARAGVQQLRADLNQAHGLNYIDQALHEHLTNQAITIYRLLTELIQVTSKAAS